jgi:hypothetical protein
MTVQEAAQILADCTQTHSEEASKAIKELGMSIYKALRKKSGEQVT